MPRRDGLATMAVALIGLTGMAVHAEPASTVHVELDEALVNQILARGGPIEITREVEGELDLGVAKVPWSITPTFRIEKITVAIEAETIRLQAQVSVVTPEFSYTEQAEGRVRPTVEGQHLLLDVVSLSMPLRLEVSGRPVDLGAFDLATLLPPDVRRLRFDLEAQSLPVEVSGKAVADLGLRNPRLSFGERSLRVDAELVVVEPPQSPSE